MARCSSPTWPGEVSGPAWIEGSEFNEEGDFVIMTGHFEGTHKADLDLSAIGAGVIPASGKKIVWPEVSVKITVEGDQIVREEAYGEGGGMEAFLAPLGVELPLA